MSDLSLKVVVLFVDFISIAKYVALIAVVTLVLVTILIKTAAFAVELICSIARPLIRLMTKPVAEAIAEFRKVKEDLVAAMERIAEASHRALTPRDDHEGRVVPNPHAGHVCPACDRRQGPTPPDRNSRDRRVSNLRDRRVCKK